MTVREIAFRLLLEYELENKYVNLCLSSPLVNSLPDKDRGFLTALLYGTVENKLRYDYQISFLSKRQTTDIDISTLCILRLGMCQIEMDTIPDFAAVNETVKLSRNKGERGFVNGVLRSYLRLKERDELPLPKREKNAARYLGVKYSYPLNLTKRFISILGEEETERLFVALSSAPHTDLTVNTRKITREALLEKIIAMGYDASPTEHSSLGIRINGSCNPTRLYGFSEGYFFVEDEASMIAVEALGVKKGDTVIDVCACPGGKSFASAILTGESGRVLSFDISESKLPLISSSRDRLGLDNLSVSLGDGSVLNSELLALGDKVICDCPCSGLGVLAKKPDMRYTVFDRLDTLPPLQRAILYNSAKYVKPGGRLLYSTCTLNPDENEGVVRAFLEDNTDFAPEGFTVGDLRVEGGILTLFPHIHNTDGFFIAVLRKKND